MKSKDVMMAGRMEKIEYKFVGGDADEKHLNFYDGSRFLYGAARFLYHIEHFRTTGDITPNVRTKDINFVLQPPREGSFIFEVVQASAPLIAEAAIKVPIQTMFSYAWSLVLPNKQKIAETTLAIEKEKTQQAIQKTTQDNIKLASDVVGHLAEANQRYADIINTYQARDNLISNYEYELSKITEKQKNKLLQKLRPAAIEMGKPLYRSTDKLVISGGKNDLVYLDKINVEALKGNIVEENPYTLLGKIIQYNNESGWGKFRNSHHGKLSFKVSTDKKRMLEHKIIDAMKSKLEIMPIFYSVRDVSGSLAYLILDGFAKDENIV